MNPLTDKTKKTKIIATIGPVSKDKKVLKDMVVNGMDCVRINTSHGDFNQYSEIVENIKSVEDLPVMLDTEGPNVRLKTDKPINVVKGDLLKVWFKNGNNGSHQPCFNSNFSSKVKINNSVLFHDGSIEFKVKEKDKNFLILEAKDDGIVGFNASVNVPSIDIKMPILTFKDKKVVSFAKAVDADFIALSFTKNARDILHVKKMLNNDDISIIAKIETKQSLDNFQEILNVSEGIMVARGDLGVEIPPEKLPLIQKNLIRQTNQSGKISIVATQLLASMVSYSRPTRAETSDVANAILDGAGCLMLSNETTIGKHPVTAVSTLKEIALNTEPSVDVKVETKGFSSLSDVIGSSVFLTAEHLSVDRIIVVTSTGFTARMISRFRPKQEIIAVTNSLKSWRKLRLVYGIHPIFYAEMPVYERILNTLKFCFDSALVSKNETVLLTGGLYTKMHNLSNAIEVLKVRDALRYYDSFFELKLSNKELVCSNCSAHVPVLYCCNHEMKLKNNRLICSYCSKEVPLIKARQILEKKEFDFIKAFSHGVAHAKKQAKRFLNRKKNHEEIPFNKSTQ